MTDCERCGEHLMLADNSTLRRYAGKCKFGTWKICNDCIDAFLVWLEGEK